MSYSCCIAIIASVFFTISLSYVLCKGEPCVGSNSRFLVNGSNLLETPVASELVKLSSDSIKFIAPKAYKLSNAL